MCIFRKLAFSTNAFTKYSVEQAITMIARIGYAGVELLADKPHLFAHELDAAQIDRVKRILTDNDLAVSNINANTASGYYEDAPPEPFFEPALSNPDKKLRKWRTEYTKRCIDLAKEVSATSVSITSGKSMLGKPPEEAIELFKDSLSEILSYAQSKGVKVGIEYEPGLLVETADEVWVLIDEMESSVLGVNLDVGHSYIAGENPAQVILDFSSRLLSLHLEDIREKKHYHRVPGTGDIDFLEIGEALQKIDFTGFATVELYNHSDEPELAAKESLAFLTAGIGQRANTSRSGLVPISDLSI
jgi:sugar phosphate isomerase/epimerase